MKHFALLLSVVLLILTIGWFASAQITNTAPGATLGGNVFSVQQQAPGYASIGGFQSVGFGKINTNDLCFAAGTTTVFAWCILPGAPESLVGVSTVALGWSGGASAAALDTALSRDAATIVDVGNGTVGNTTGSVKLAGVLSAGTKFTASGCSVSATAGGATAGTYTSGTSGACTVVITMNGATGLTAPNGWACTASDRTTVADIQQNTASTTTTATIAGTTVTGDVISFHCTGY